MSSGWFPADPTGPSHPLSRGSQLLSVVTAARSIFLTASSGIQSYLVSTLGVTVTFICHAWPGTPLPTLTMARPPVTQTYTQFQSDPGVMLNVSQLGYQVILTRALCTMVHTLQLRVSRLREVRKITNNCRTSMWQNRDSNLAWMLSPELC